MRIVNSTSGGIGGESATTRHGLFTPLSAVGMRLVIFLSVFVGMRIAMLRLFRLPESAYYNPSLVVGWLAYFGWVEWTLLAAAVIALWYFGDPEIWRGGWNHLHFGHWLRFMVGVVAGLLAWMFSTYAFNYYYGQSHLPERLLLIGLALLLLWRPLFVFPFLAVLISVVTQFDYPLGVGYERPIATMLINVLLAFAAFFAVRCVSHRIQNIDFFFLTGCILAANFWWPGFGKLKLNWLLDGQVYLFLLGGYAHGWWAFLTPETIVNAARWLSHLDPAVRLLTVLLEWGALFFLWRYASAGALLIGWMLFHLGIFAVSGFFFWPWILTEAAFLFVLVRGRAVFRSRLFCPVYFGLSLLLIAFGRPLFQPPGLAWYDTPLCYTYRFEALGISGERYELPPSFFAPYRDIFTFGKFAYLTPEPQLVSSYGATSNRAIAMALLEARSAADVFALEQKKSPHPVDEQRAGVLDRFIRTFVGRKNVDSGASWGMGWLAAPPIFWTFSRGNAYRGKERIRRIEIYQVTTFFDYKQLREIRKRKIREIEVPIT